MLRGRVPSPAVPAGSVWTNGARWWQRDRGSRPSVCSGAGVEWAGKGVSTSGLHVPGLVKVSWLLLF